MKSPKELHKEASAAAQTAAENCHPKTPSELGFAFVKFEGFSAWSFWAQKQGLVIRSPSRKKDHIMMIKHYDSSMAKKIAYAEAYADYMTRSGVKARVKIDV